MPDDNKTNPEEMHTDAPGTGAKTVGGRTTASGAGDDQHLTGGTTGVETEKSTGDDGVTSGGSLKAALNDAGITPETTPDNPRQDTPNPT
jgi:hypothetical protein